MTGPIRWKSEANANPFGVPDQGAPRGAQQTQPSDEELAQIADNLKKEAADKEKDKKPEGSDENKPEGDGDGDGDGVSDGDDSSETDDTSDDDSGDEDADSEEGEGESDESEESEEEGTEDSEGEGETDGDDDDSEEGEGDSEEDEGDEEATAGTVGQKHIFRGEASSSFEYRIISAFPGVGKTHLFGNTGGLRISDSDSSTFDKSQFPMNYVDHIQKVQYENDLCLVSSHSEVRAELKARKENYLLVYPARCCKDEYLARYLRRGSNAAFVELMDSKWDDFIDTCELEEGPTHVLQPGQYLSDLLPYLED